MTFLAPIYLLALLPWVAVAAWMLTSQHERTAVPFLNLWRNELPSMPRASRSLHRPPWPVVAMLLSSLVAVLAGAAPAWKIPPLLSVSGPTTRTTRNVSIVHAGAAATPRAQIMVRLRNDSDLSQATLSVGTIAQSITLPSSGNETNYFVDLPALESATVIELNVQDDEPIDNRVILHQQKGWPKLERVGSLPREVERMLDVYAKVRPAGADAVSVIISSTPSEPTRAAVIVPPTTAPADGPIQFESHSINQHIDWSSAKGQNLRIAYWPGNEWRAIVSSGSRPIVAVRENPARQVWIGFSSETFAASADFVIFWTNVLDWTGSASPSEQIERASAPATQPAPARSEHGRVDLRPIFLMCSILLLLLGCLGTVRKNPGRRSSPDAGV